MGWTGLYHHAASDYLLLTQHDRYHLRASGERGGMKVGSHVARQLLSLVGAAHTVVMESGLEY